MNKRLLVLVLVLFSSISGLLADDTMSSLKKKSMEGFVGPRTRRNTTENLMFGAGVFTGIGIMLSLNGIVDDEGDSTPLFAAGLSFAAATLMKGVRDKIIMLAKKRVDDFLKKED